MKHTSNASSITVWGTSRENIFRANKVPSAIDFISVEVEGAEVPIIEQLCGLKNYRVACGCIEHNGRKYDYARIVSLLEGSGYKVVWMGQTQHDLFFIDKRERNGE